jgi:large conductance mechanosensitive channel
LLQEFKAFAMRGNVVDLAVGVVIGGAFGKIVTALVDKMIMPVVGFLTGGIDIAGLHFTPIEVEGVKKPTLGYGAFLQEVVNFMIIAAVLFLLIKTMNALKNKQEATPPPPPATPEDVLLLREIRDSLIKSVPRRAE